MVDTYDEVYDKTFALQRFDSVLRYVPDLRADVCHAQRLYGAESARAGFAPRRDQKRSRMAAGPERPVRYGQGRAAGLFYLAEKCCYRQFRRQLAVDRSRHDRVSSDGLVQLCSGSGLFHSGNCHCNPSWHFGSQKTVWLYRLFCHRCFDDLHLHADLLPGHAAETGVFG